MNVFKGWDKIYPALAARPRKIIVLPLPVYPCQSYASDEEYGFPYGAVMVVAWFHEIMA
jgi:hypothetical protein